MHAGDEPVDQDLLKMLDAVFAERRTAAGCAPITHDHAFWRTLDSLGLASLTRTESNGGSGAGWREAAALLRAAARHCVSIPYLEHDLLASWLADVVGLDGEASTFLSAALLDSDGCAESVGWASDAESLIVAWPGDVGWQAASLRNVDVRIDSFVNRAGEPRDRLLVDVAPMRGRPVPAALVEEFRLRSALARSVQISASMDEVVRLSVAHALERHQFGRPIAKFQAVQQLVAQAASQSAMVRAAVESAVTSVATDGILASGIQIASAASCASHTASSISRTAHQVLGAIGTTMEHPLHLYTDAIAAWRADLGSPRSWDERLVSAAMRHKTLWPMLVSGGRLELECHE